MFLREESDERGKFRFNPKILSLLLRVFDSFLALLWRERIRGEGGVASERPSP
jgi:hypothetical protein